MTDWWEAEKQARGWLKVATGTWLYDRTIPMPIAVWAIPSFDSSSRYDEEEKLDESRPIPETLDGYLYITVPGRDEFLTVAAAKASADAQPWGPVSWD